MIIRIIKIIIHWFKNHFKEVLAGAFGIGAVGAAVGVAESQKAKKINKSALLIQQEAQDKYDLEFAKTQEVLNSLGEAKKASIDKMASYARVLDKISKSLSPMRKRLLGLKLPQYTIEEIKVIPAQIQMAVVGAGGAGFGAMAGLAIFGINAVAAAPAMVGGGLVICSKGIALKKKAVENKHQAVQMKKDIDEILSVYANMRKFAETMQKDITELQSKCDNIMPHLNDLVKDDNFIKRINKEDKIAIQNAYWLLELIHEICNTPIVTSQQSKDKLEKVNSDELSKLHKKAELLVEET